MAHSVPREGSCTLTNQHKHEFLPLRTSLFPYAPKWKHDLEKPMHGSKTSYTKLDISVSVDQKHHRSWSGRGYTASQPASPQQLSRRAKMHQSLLILAAPERWSGLQYEAMSSTIGPACSSTVWKHNAGILMDRTACPLSPMVIHTTHAYIHTLTHKRAVTGRLCAHIKEPEIYIFLRADYTASGLQTGPEC